MRGKGIAHCLLPGVTRHLKPAGADPKGSCLTRPQGLSSKSAKGMPVSEQVVELSLQKMSQRVAGTAGESIVHTHTYGSNSPYKTILRCPLQSM